MSTLFLYIWYIWNSPLFLSRGLDNIFCIEENPNWEYPLIRLYTVRKVLADISLYLTDDAVAKLYVT